MKRNPTWMVRRLFLMSPGEVLIRSMRAVQSVADRWRTRKRPVLARAAEFTGKEFPAGTPFFGLAADDRIRSAARIPYTWDESPARAYLAHQLSFFAFQGKDFGSTIRWNHDYSTGKDTPTEFGPTLDYRDPEKCGDIKYAWEHNRHHHLVELAKAWYLTGNEAYAHEVVQQVDSWIESCPYMYGINWASSLESAIRIINWCCCLSFLRSGIGSVVESFFVKKWVASIHEHLRFISRNFSGYSSANNHLIGEASGLFVGSLCCRFPESGQWIRKSKSILEREVLRQNWPDGVNKEQAMAYQAFVFDFLLFPGLLARQNEMEFSGEYWARLEKMADFVNAVIDEHGQVPQFGDDDEGYVVRLSHQPGFRQFRSMLATSAKLFGREDLKAKATENDEKTFWLTGQTDKPMTGTKPRPVKEARAFPHGGYYIISGGGARMIFDCGPLGYLSLAAHGHADALSCVFDYNGRAFLVDPGTYAYHTKRRWRDYFRGTSAHNTIVVDGENQSVIGGNFMWTRKARCTVIHSSDHRIRARHDGYTRLPSPAIHEREVRFLSEQNAYLIADNVIGAGRRGIEQFFHFSPECELAETEGSYIVENRGERIRLVPDPLLAASKVHTGETDPIRGWHSPGFDRKTPSPSLRCVLDADGGVELKTMIYLL